MELSNRFRRRALAAAGIAAVLGVVIAGLVDPVSTRGGAIILAVAASVLASLIVAAVALERNEFAHELLRLGIDRVFDDRLHDIPNGLWANELAGVSRHFCVLGMANHGYIGSEVEKQRTSDALRKALSRKKVTVEFLWLDPETDIARVREEEEDRRSLRGDTCGAIEFFFEFARSLPKEQSERLSLRVYRSLPTCGITWADDRLIVTHYLAGGLNLRAPGLVLEAAEPVLSRSATKIQPREPHVPPLTHAYMRNYREVASDNWSRPIDEATVTTLRALREELEETQPDKQSEAEIRAEEPPPPAPDTGG